MLINLVVRRPSLTVQAHDVGIPLDVPLAVVETVPVPDFAEQVKLIFGAFVSNEGIAERFLELAEEYQERGEVTESEYLRACNIVRDLHKIRQYYTVG